MPIRVLIADDDPDVRGLYRGFFEAHPDFELAAEAADGEAAVAAFTAHRPDVTLMDLEMPLRDGVWATQGICAADPSACVVVLTSFATRDYIVAALRAGAAGYLVKAAGGGAIAAGIRQALDGDMPLSSSVRRQLVATLTPSPAPPTARVALTPRETELVTWLAHGMTNQQIATRMHLSQGSVKQYVARVSGKLGVVSRTQVLVRVIQLGIVDPADLPAVGSG
ncbi:MAG: response regulator [Arachnia sp.]